MTNYIPIIEEQVVDKSVASQSEASSLETREQRQMQTPAQTAMDAGPLPWTQRAEVDDFYARWNAVQVEFVDQPRASVAKADELVVEVLEKIEKAFSNNRTLLNEQWSSQPDISTENLRIVLQNYRSFFNRVLSL